MLKSEECVYLHILLARLTTQIMMIRQFHKDLERDVALTVAAAPHFLRHNLSLVTDVNPICGKGRMVANSGDVWPLIRLFSSLNRLGREAANFPS
jgi:hypothetical protein